jgi:hypothetical protein
MNADLQQPIQQSTAGLVVHKGKVKPLLPSRTGKKLD